MLLTVAVAACDRVFPNAAVGSTEIDLNQAMPPYTSSIHLEATRRDAALALAFETRNSNFDEFLAANKKITFDDLSESRPVQDLPAFTKMQGYFLNLYSGVEVAKSIEIGNQTFDCIPVQQQPSLRGGQIADLPPEGGSNDSILGDPEKVCDPGQIPIKRVSLSEISQYQTLKDYFSKDKGIGKRLGAGDYKFSLPIPGTPLPSAGAGRDNFVHHYAVIVSKPVGIFGLRANLNIWNPKTAPTDMSLAQTWIAGGAGSETQTIESGWQVRKGLDLPYAVPFVYWTSNNYASGCYNLDCAGFVQITNQIVFGRFAEQRYSVKGGTQSVMQISWRRKSENGNWWLMINGVWVGYYPASIFSGGAMVKKDAKLTAYFGGENTGNLPTSEMGSGNFASTGYKNAAFLSNLSALDASGSAFDISGTGFVTNSNCYSVALGISPPSTTAGSYFYFGGPGTAEPVCAKSPPSG